MELLLALIILILSVIVHEVAHGYAADAFGDPTARLAGRLTMNPLPHIDFVGSLVIPALLVFTSSPILFGWAKPVPYNPYNLRNRRVGETVVALAGSATNLFFAVVFGLLVRYGAALGLDATAISLAATIAFINLFLGLFNLIPFPPLDGFTALRAMLPWKSGSALERFERRVQSGGVFSLIIFLLAFSLLFAGPFFAFALWIFKFITGG